MIFKGTEYPIYELRLSDYFKKHPNRKPKVGTDKECSGSWRGYQAIFEVSNGVIYLKDIFSDPCDQRKPVLKKVVPDGKPLAIDWYTGLLRSMDGPNPVFAYSEEFPESFEKYTFFQVDKGRINQVRSFDNKGYHEFKRRQFEAYKKAPKYQKDVKDLGDKPREKSDERIYRNFLFLMERFYID